ALDDHLSGYRNLEADAGAGPDRRGVRVADVQLEIVALQGGAVADALDLELLLEPLRDAFDHVRDQRAGETVQRAVLAALGRARHGQGAVVLRDLHARGHLLLEGAQRTGHRHTTGIDRDGDAVGNLDWSFAD